MYSMNCVTVGSNDNINNLRYELNTINSHIGCVCNIGLSEETAEAVIKELTVKKNEIKERFHNLIDTL